MSRIVVFMDPTLERSTSGLSIPGGFFMVGAKGLEPLTFFV